MMGSRCNGVHGGVVLMSLGLVTMFIALISELIPDYVQTDPFSGPTNEKKTSHHNDRLRRSIELTVDSGNYAVDEVNEDHLDQNIVTLGCGTAYKMNQEGSSQSGGCFRKLALSALPYPGGTWFNLFVDLKFSCAGHVTGWDFYAYNPGTFIAAVWRLQAGDCSPQQYRMIGSTAIEAKAIGKQQIQLKSQHQIKFRRGDVISIQYPTVEKGVKGVIPYADSRHELNKYGYSDSDLSRIVNLAADHQTLMTSGASANQVHGSVRRLPALTPIIENTENLGASYVSADQEITDHVINPTDAQDSQHERHKRDTYADDMKFVSTGRQPHHVSFEKQTGMTQLKEVMMGACVFAGAVAFAFMLVYARLQSEERHSFRHGAILLSMLAAEMSTVCACVQGFDAHAGKTLSDIRGQGMTFIFTSCAGALCFFATVSFILGSVPKRSSGQNNV